MLFERSIDRVELAARAGRAAKYAAWLRNAPLERKGTATVTPDAAKWTPEPLAPALAHSGLAVTSLDAALRAEPRSSLDFRLFDPLGYASQPLDKAHRAMEATIDAYGFGACGPRGFYGTTKPHLELEAALARFLGVDSAIVYSAGVATASSVLPALVQPGDHVIVDSEVHLGIRTGLRLCKAEVSWVPHGDVGAIKDAISSRLPADRSGPKPQQMRTFIVVEALCQRTGCVAPLEELLAVKDKYGALLMLDESLSIGTLGAHGRGLCELCGIDTARVDAIIGSLEHAFASVGGFCAGRRGLVEHQRLAGAGYCFSASSPPAACSAVTATLADLEGEGGGGRLASIRTNSTLLHDALCVAVSATKVELISSPESFVKHLRWAGDASEAEAKLLEAVHKSASSGGVRVQVCSPASCPAEGAFGARLHAPPTSAPSIRLSASAAHSAADIAAACAALQAALEAL